MSFTTATAVFIRFPPPQQGLTLISLNIYIYRIFLRTHRSVVGTGSYAAAQFDQVLDVPARLEAVGAHDVVAFEFAAFGEELASSTLTCKRKRRNCELIH